MNLFNNKKIVISGGPGSGKTTLVNLLRVKGYECIDEFSRILIKRAQKQGKNNIFKTQPLEFSKKVWNGRKEQYKNSKPNSNKTQGVSRVLSAVTISFPTPFQPKIYSTKTAPGS